METLLYFATLSLVVCLTLCFSKNKKENDEDETLHEVLDREKRDAMPQPWRKHFMFQFL